MQRSAVFSLVVLLGSACATHDGRDVPYVGTSQAVLERMLELARLRPGDVLYDLGSGDGRIAI